MKRLLIAMAAAFIISAMVAPSTGKEVLKKMHDQYAGKWYRTLTFNQTTEIYKNDSLKRFETWYEYVQFPSSFRINFGNADSDNAVIFKNDSSFVFRNSQKVKQSFYRNDLLFLIGGMYFYPFDEMLAGIKSFGFDYNKFHEDVWKGKSVYVIGASNQADTTNQLWIEKEHFNIVRMIKFENNRKEEALFEGHVKLDGGYSETLVHFYINDQLIQVEKYHNLKPNASIDPAIFNTEKLTRINY